MTIFRDDATVFGWDADPAEVQAARDRGEHVVILRPRLWPPDRIVNKRTGTELEVTLISDDPALD